MDRETGLIVIVVSLGILLTLFGVMSDPVPKPSKPMRTSQKSNSKQALVDPAKVPLATGDEPIETLFRQSGCPVCHTIPGVPGAKGREGPQLVLGTTASQRLKDPSYRGTASTEWEYITESILNPGAYIVPGYPDRVMPRWYGQKLSAAALQKITHYLQQITETS